MRLLDKQTTSTLKTIERKKEIEEGKKLASKIDALRELSAKEQVNLIKFRDESLKKVIEEIQQKTIERDSLSSEVISLRVERQFLMEPLDAEWMGVRNALHEIDVQKEKNYLIESALKLKSVSLDSREHDVAIEEQRIADMRKQSQDSFDWAQQKLAEADGALLYAKSVADSSLKEKQDSNNDISYRMTTIAQKERELDIQKESVENMKEKNTIERRQLEDQRKTLERAFNRLKK